MITDPEQKIARPRHVYTGQASRDVVPIEKRVASATRATA
jgi:citrate synthase